MPCSIPNDRSKKRLIQDTEDWQPRTGTTQSRSFRILAQLTGTDFSKSGTRTDRDGREGERQREGVGSRPWHTTKEQAYYDYLGLVSF